MPEGSQGQEHRASPAVGWRGGALGGPRQEAEARGHLLSDRRADRLASAALRAAAGDRRADIRGGRLEVADRAILVVVPYLTLPGLAGRPEPVRRGVVDALGLRVRHSDPELHLRLSPEPLLERVVFDIAEQFRCEALGWSGPNVAHLTGMRTNTAAAFTAWSDAARAARVGETGVGLLVFTITHMIRSRLLRIPTDESVDDLIEVTRGNLARLVGHALKALPSVIGDQDAFAEPAREIARLLAELVADAEESTGETPADVTANALLIPIDWDLLELVSEGGGAALHSPAAGESDYHVYTTAYDVEVAGADLYPDPVLRRLRRELDANVAAQAVSLSRLALRLQRLFPSHRFDGWRGGTDDGLIDPGRLAQLVADPTNRLVRRQPHYRPSTDAAVTFLLDTSGSMKVQRYESLAVLVDTMVRALEAAGAETEVLGFTTASWAGGRPRAEWRAAGSPPDPGRLNELQHIVYKEAGRTWRQARLGLAAMGKTDHYREGVDGEALAWAHQRLLDRAPGPGARRVLVIVSDGAPMDAATTEANRPRFLADHLRATAQAIEYQSLVELGAVGVDQELDAYVTRSVPLDLSGTLTMASYSVLDQLFG